jgi:hypothetical protein
VDFLRKDGEVLADGGPVAFGLLGHFFSYAQRGRARKLELTRAGSWRDRIATLPFAMA